MDSPISELLTVAIQAAMQEANQQNAIVQAKISAICEVYGIGADSASIRALPEPARAIVIKLTEDYVSWNAAKEQAHTLIANVRRDTAR